jgi:DNA (cytosine-5)-methyltransferase 1
MSGLVLSLFPGIGLLDMAFEEEGFCVVRGPDLLWGGDIRRFHPPAGKFDGVIGGPPCKWWSSAANIAKARGQLVQPDMIPEFVRCIDEAQPDWFLMENVLRAPVPDIAGFAIEPHIVDANWFGADQRRRRRMTFGARSGMRIRPVCEALHASPNHGTVTTRNLKWDARRGRPRSTNTLKSFGDACEAQGLPRDFLAKAPFTSKGKWECLGNGVPLLLGVALARAIKRAIDPSIARVA